MIQMYIPDMESSQRLDMKSRTIRLCDVMFASEKEATRSVIYFRGASTSKQPAKQAEKHDSAGLRVWNQQAKKTDAKKEATMIYIKIDNDVFYDDAVVLVRSFYPRTEVMALKADSKPEEKDEILSIEVPDVTGLDKKNAHEVFKDSLYKKLSEKTGKKLPWGYLTGVRPSKIAYTMLEEGATKEQIKKHFMDKHYASEDKAELALTVAKERTGYTYRYGL